MKIKKIFLILIMFIFLTGCSNLDEFQYDEMIAKFSMKSKPANTYKKGYKFYVPKGLHIGDAGDNYVILTSSDINYYLYVDLVSYNDDKKLHYEKKDNSIYSKKIKTDEKEGYIEVNLWENNQYLIEIMYNYAKIEVMVDRSLGNKALANSISILNSIKYNDTIIENILKDDNLTYTEEIFDMFEETKDNSNYLDYEETDENLEEQEKIKDTDFIN